MIAAAWLGAAAAAAIGVAGTMSRAAAHPPAGIAVHEDRVTWIDGGSWRLVTVDGAGAAPGEAGEAGGAIDSAGPRVIPHGPGGPMRMPHHLVVGPGGRLHTVDDATGDIQVLGPDGLEPWRPGGETPSGPVGRDGLPFAIDAGGAVWWVDETPGRTCRIIRQAPGGVPQPVAGGAVGHADGQGASVRFTSLHPGGMAWTSDGDLVVTDGRRWVRLVEPDGSVRTIAGGAPGALRDGAASNAGFGSLGAVAVAPDGSIVVIDAGHRCVRVIDPADGSVRTIGGLEPGPGPGDGAPPRPRVRFEDPAGVAVDDQGRVWVLDHAVDGTRAVRLGPGGEIEREFRFDPAARDR